MGIYLETPVDVGKADWLVANAGAASWAGETYEQVPAGKVLVIVLENRAGSPSIAVADEGGQRQLAHPRDYDAAAVIFDEREWQLKTMRIGAGDSRPHRFLVLDVEAAVKLDPSGVLGRELSANRRSSR